MRTVPSAIYPMLVACVRFTIGMRPGRTLVVLAAVAALVVGACGEDDDTAANDKPVTVDVGILPISDLAPLYLGTKKGFFAQEKLTVRPRVTQGGSAIVAPVVSGDFEFGWSNTTSLIIARSKGLPVKIISRGARGGSTPRTSSTDILVKRDGPIKTAKDLEGRTISVPVLQSIATLTANAALEKRGVDVSKVKYIEIPIPQAVAALEKGRIDAAFVGEPFATAGLQAGHRSISRPILETAPNYINATYFATERYIADNKDVVDRFVRAVTKSFDYASAHPDEVRAILPTYTEIPPMVAQRMRLPDFSRYTDMSTIELTADLAKKYGYIKSDFDVSELLYRP